MKKLLTILFTFALFAIILAGSANAQIPVTVTNPGNTTPNLQANYSSLALALTDLNLVTAMTGPVTLTLTGGNAEITPPTGLVIGSASLNPVLSATNTVTINTTGGVVTLNAGTGTATPASPAPDGILAIVGADYITIDGITFTDGNAANPGTMEFGVGLFKFSVSDGAQYNTIQNCIFNMQSINNATGSGPMVEGSVGIRVVNATNIAATTALTPTAATGTNSYNKFYTNVINGGNYGIALYGYSALTPFTLGDTGNDIGGSFSGQGNQILNFGGAAAATNPAAGIRANFQWGINISYNMINNNNGGGFNHVSTLRGIYGQAGVSANATINNNNITIKGGGTTTQVAAIENVIGSTAAGNTVNINNNAITGEYLTATSGTFYGILNSSSAATVNINFNNIHDINYSGAALAGSGTLYLINNSGAATNINANNNTINNIARTGTTGSTTIGIYLSSGTNQTANNNTVSNMSISGAGTASTMYGIQTSATTVVVNTNNVFNLNVIKTTGTGALYGIYNISSPTNENYNNNTVYSLTHLGTGVVYGIYAFTTTGTRTMSGNTVYGLSTAGITIAGLNNTSSSPNVFKNKVYNIQSTSTGNAVVSGIILGSLGTSGVANIYNNYISDLKAPTGTISGPTAPAIRGINITTTTTSSAVNVSYNTIYLNASSTAANFGSCGLFATSSVTATTAALTLKNNIIDNNSTPAGTGLAVAYQRSAIDLANYVSTSNNNDFYAGTPGISNLIFYDGTNSDQTIAAYKTRVSPRDASSFSENPPFVNAPANDLHMNTAIATQTESGGIPISTPIAITTDFDGDVRNATTPDVGADEFAGVGLDLAAPVISYTPFGNTSLLSSRTLSTSISDYTGVPTAGIGLPVLYWRINSGSYAGVQGTYVSGSTYTFTFGGGVSLGDTVKYFIVAQDLVVPPNVGGYPAGGTGYSSDPPNVTTPTSTPSSYLIVGSPLSGDYTVGLTAFNKASGRNIYYETRTVKETIEVPVYSMEKNENGDKAEQKITGFEKKVVDKQIAVPMENGREVEEPLYHYYEKNNNKNSPLAGVYPTITAAVADLILRGVSGPVRFLLLDASYSETVPITITPFAGASSTNTVTILPNTSVVSTISGSSATSIFVLNAADYVIIDGSNSGGTDRSLTISNTNTGTSSACVWMQSNASDGATNNAIKNCNLTGNGNTQTLFGVGSGSSTISLTSLGTGNSNNSILNNNISKTQFGIYTQGASAANKNTGIIINNNLINTASPNNVSKGGIQVGFCDNILIKGNKIDGITQTSSPDVFGITLGMPSISTSTLTGNEVTNASVSENYIGNITNTGTFSAVGISVAPATSGTNVISNNMIYGVGANGTAGDVGAGIILAGGSGSTTNVYYNSVSITGTFTGGSYPNYGVAIGGTDPTVNVKDNIFFNTAANGTGTSYAIGTASATFVNLTSNYNDFYTALGSGFAIGHTGSLAQGSGTNQILLGDWQTATGKDANSISGDPKFISTSDLHINSAQISPVNDAATPIAGITTDIDGDTRNVSTPDIGADEYVYVPLPGIAIAPSSKAYGSVQVGSSSPDQTFIITNPGSLNLVITSLTKTGTDPGEFILTDLNVYPKTLTPADTAIVKVKFSPTSLGAKSASLSFADNAPGSPHTVPLTGTGTAGTWTSLGNSGVTSILRSVSVVDNNVAFISGDAGVILKTTNGGTNWTNMFSAPLSNTVGCDVVRVIDANTVLTAQNGTSAILYKSTDGGLTWAQVLSEVGGYFDDFLFKDANNGFMYGDPVGGRWSLWRTTNGGTTWDSAGLYLPQVSGEAGWDNAMSMQGNNLWFGTNSTHIYRSTDFGTSWISTATTGITTSTDISFSGNVGFVTGNGITLKSTDAGATWSTFTTPGIATNVHFESLGSRYWIAQTNMYYSTDNGAIFPLSYTYPGTGGPMWNTGANITGTQLTVFVSGYAGGIWKYTEPVAPAGLTLGLTAMFSGLCNGTNMNFTKDVTVELHSATTPYALVESKAVTLDVNGLANPLYTVAVNGTPYYIVIKSSNGLETWSATPQTFSGSTLSYDFTTAATQAYGSNMLLVGTKWCIISGDADQNGTVNAVDRSLCWNDRNLVGVYATDFDGNGTVNALDRSIAWNNRNLSVAKPALALSPENKGVKKETIDKKGNTKGTYDLRLDGKNSKNVNKKSNN